jgi:putative tricarboxylic transport membrane protein
LFGGYVVTEGFRLGLGGLHQPGPGFFPAVAGIFLIFLSAFLFFRSVLPTSRAMGRMARGEEERPWLVVYALAGILVYALIFEWLGFILSTFLLVTFLLRLLNPRKWWTTLLTAGVISLSAYAVFDVLLKSGLPKGVLEEFF